MFFRKTAPSQDYIQRAKKMGDCVPALVAAAAPTDSKSRKKMEAENKRRIEEHRRMVDQKERETNRSRAERLFEMSQYPPLTPLRRGEVARPLSPTWHHHGAPPLPPPRIALPHPPRPEVKQGPVAQRPVIRQNSRATPHHQTATYIPGVSYSAQVEFEAVRPLNIQPKRGDRHATSPRRDASQMQIPSHSPGLSRRDAQSSPPPQMQTPSNSVGLRRRDAGRIPPSTQMSSSGRRLVKPRAPVSVPEYQSTWY